MDEPDENRRPERPGASVDEEIDGSDAVSVPEADAFRFDHVDQTDPANSDGADRALGGVRGPVVHQGLTLRFDGGGIKASGPEDGHRALIRWTDVDRASFGVPAAGPDGQTETCIDLETAAGPIHYLVRSEGTLAVAVAALEIQVDRWMAAARAHPTPDDPLGSGVVVAPPAVTPPSPQPSDPTEPSRPSPDPSPAALVGYPPLAPYAFDTSGPIRPYDLVDPFGLYDPSGVGGRSGATRRTRRTAILVVALVLVASGVGLAVGLTTTTTTPPPPRKVATAPVPSSDQRLAQQLLLTKADLPAGWRESTNPGTAANSPALERGEARITSNLARCMGISDAEGAIVLGGDASDQTAQTSSPIFVAPTSGAATTAVELQTAATVVRTHGDEQRDLGLFANPKYPQCVATASADELQLGVNQTSGGGDHAGPATVSPVDLPGTSGVQLSGLLMAFTVVDGTATIPVQVESITLGAHRVEAGLEVFAIGGQIPSQTLSASIATFERRVASGGASSVV